MESTSEEPNQNPDEGDSKPSAEPGESSETQAESTESAPDATPEACGDVSEAAEVDAPGEASILEESKEPKEANFPPIDPAAGSDAAKAGEVSSDDTVCSSSIKL